MATNLVKKAPVTSLSSIESLTAFTLTFLVAHHIIGTVDVSATTQTIAPFIALALPAVFGAAKWALVTPYDKAKRWAENEGIFTDADFGRVEQLVESQFEQYLAKAEDGESAPDDDVTAPAEAAARDDEQTGADDGDGPAPFLRDVLSGPRSMNAGAPDDAAAVLTSV